MIVHLVMDARTPRGCSTATNSLMQQYRQPARPGEPAFLAPDAAGYVSARTTNQECAELHSLRRCARPEIVGLSSRRLDARMSPLNGSVVEHTAAVSNLLHVEYDNVC